MNTLLLLLIIIAVILVVAAAAGWTLRPKTGPTRRERELETRIDEIREIAYQYRDVDQGLAEAIISKIAEYNRKELS